MQTHCPRCFLKMIPKTQGETDPAKVVCPKCGRAPGDK